MISRLWCPTWALIDLKNVEIRFQDGDTPPNYIEVKIGEGDLSYTETKERDFILDRGRLDEVRNGDESPMEVDFQFKWDYLTGPSGSGAVPTPEDVLKRRGAAADWVSTDDDPCHPYCIDIVLLNVPSPSGCGDQETITLPDFFYESIPHTLRDSQISCTGRCNATEATVVRAAQS